MQTALSEIETGGRIAAAVLALSVLTMGSMTQAQTNTASRPRAPLAGPNEATFAGGLGRFAQERLLSILTEEQRASLREITAGQWTKVRESEEKAREARRAMYEAALVDKFDEETVRQKAMAVAKLDAEVTVLRLKALSQVRPPLSAEQLQKLSAASMSPDQSGNETPRRRRPDIPRDENGLPPRDRVPAEPK